MTMSPSAHDEVRIVAGVTSFEFVFVPAGTFLMGTNAERAPAVASQFPGVQAEWILKEAPAHEVYLPDYHIARTPITNQLWAEYINRSSSLPPPDPADSPPDPKHPVSGITYEEVEAFCRWVSQCCGHRVTLPTEAQWEKAARGVDGREWPWGNKFSTEKCNTREGAYGGVTAVNRFPAGASPYGALDMGGNVEEWTSDLYRPYPGGEVATNGFGGPGHRVTRGDPVTGREEATWPGALGGTAPGLIRGWVRAWCSTRRSAGAHRSSVFITGPDVASIPSAVMPRVAEGAPDELRNVGVQPIGNASGSRPTRRNSTPLTLRRSLYSGERWRRLL